MVKRGNPSYDHVSKAGQKCNTTAQMALIVERAAPCACKKHRLASRPAKCSVTADWPAELYKQHLSQTSSYYIHCGKPWLLPCPIPLDTV